MRKLILTYPTPKARSKFALRGENLRYKIPPAKRYGAKSCFTDFGILNFKAKLYKTAFKFNRKKIRLSLLSATLNLTRLQIRIESQNLSL